MSYKSIKHTKATEGQYKRLKKEIIDVDEIARKKLTGGKIDEKKLLTQTTKVIHDPVKSVSYASS